VPRRLLASVLTALLLVGTSTALAQRRRGGFGIGGPMRIATADSFDGSWNFCRIVFSQNPDGDGNGWFVDYPRADANLSIRLSELTKTRISRDDAGEPNHLLLRLTDDALFQCPFVMMTEPGGAYFSAEEAARLREYLLKGGFLWADDFWGSYAWDVWVHEFSKVLPPSEYPIADIPLTHPLFHIQFDVRKLPQIPSIGVWRGTGGTSERGDDSAEPHARGVADKHGRLMVLMTHNTDFGDAFEEEATDPRYFYTFSVDGYAFGINVLLYSLTH
jgi:uncharacterized protein DUF4159